MDYESNMGVWTHDFTEAKKPEEVPALADFLQEEAKANQKQVSQKVVADLSE